MTTAAAPAIALEPLDPASLLLLTVELDGATLTEGLAAYGDPADPLIPIGELTRLLELDVDVFPTERRIVGRLGESQRSLLVDVDSRTVRLGAEDIPLHSGDVAVSGEDIYLRLGLVSRLLPVVPVLDQLNQTLSLKATEKLPIQGRLERIARRRQVSGGQAPTESALNVPAPYRLASPPAFDVLMSSGLQSQLPKQIATAEVRTAADLLYTDFQGYFSTNEKGGPQTVRVLFQRQSATGLLGPLRARTVNAGDVYTPSLTLGPRSLGGRGIYLSTIPVDQADVFNQVDLRGELPLGYDVELYVNDVLRSGQNTPIKGRYEFLNVPLRPGVNVIRVVTYGPRGERNEQTRIINLGGGQLRRGQANFEIGLVDQEDPVFKLTKPLPEDFTLPTAKGLRAVANLNYGLTSNLTLNLGGAIAPTLGDDDREVLNVGARTSLFGLFTQVDVAGDSAGGRAAALGVAGQYRGVAASLHHSIYRNGFVDEGGAVFTIDRLASSRSEATFDASLNFGGIVLPASFRAQRIAYFNGDRDVAASARTSTTLGGYYLSSGVEYQRQILGLGGRSQRLAGFLAVSSFQNFRTQIRAALDFDVLPDAELDALAITVDHQLNDITTLRFGVGQSLKRYDSFNLTAGGVVRTRLADLALSGNYSNYDGSWRVAGQINFGLAYNPARGGYEMGPVGPASSGTVLFQAFIDDDGDGRFDPGEEPVPNVTVEGGEKLAKTGADGRAMIRNAGPGPAGRLQVGMEKVDELSLSTPPSVVNISPRPGGLSKVDYPIRPTGEVLVNVKLRRDDGQIVGLSAVNVILQGDTGYTAEVATEFDGGAYFEGVPIGAYTVTLDPEQAKRLRMKLKAPGKTKIERGGFAKPVEMEVTFSPPADQETG